MFYIINVRPDSKEPYYNLRLTQTQWCLSSGCSKEHMLGLIEKYYKKYKTEEGILRMIDNLEDKGVVPPIEIEHYKNLYLEQKGGLFQEEIAQIVEKCKAGNKERLKFKVKSKKKPLFKVKRRTT